MAGMTYCCVVVCLVLLFAPSVKSDVCRKTDWFGPDCVYQCHCDNNFFCDQMYGRCTNGVCEGGFAGTACQYVDFAFTQQTYSNLPYLLFGDKRDAVDGNVISCFITAKAENSTWSVKLKEASWVNRVSVFVVTNSARVDQLEVSLHNDDDDIHVVATPQVTKPNATRYYYHLPQPARVSKVQIRTTDNDTALALCDVNVYGGRNIALRKNATQGEQTRGIAVASRAVDGNTDGDFDQRSCTHTENTQGGKIIRSWWTVVLGNPQHIWRVRVYNRVDSNPRLLGWFRVNVTYDNGSTEQVYRYSGRTLPPFTDIHMQKPTVGTELTVWRYQRGRILILCEVEVYGDCLNGYFGWLCDTECRCENPDEICDKLWGTCPVSGCRAGWRGDDCQLECLNGTYGHKCGFNCSGTCRDHVCHHVTGECTNGCAPGWEGDLCKEMCQPIVFGQNCSDLCPPNCVDTRCHHVTGFCNEGCESGWMGDNCTEPCARGFHGLNCGLTCSADCVNNTCDATSGECTEGCVAGRTGHHCGQNTGFDHNNEVSPFKYSVLVGAVCGILALITISGLAVVWLRRWQNTQNAKRTANTDSPESRSTLATVRPQDAGLHPTASTSGTGNPVSNNANDDIQCPDVSSHIPTTSSSLARPSSSESASSYLTPTPWSMDDSKYIKMDGASCIKMDKLNATAEYHNTQLRENTVYTNAPPDLDNEPDGAAAGTEPPNNYEKLQLYENTRGYQIYSRLFDKKDKQ